MKRAGDYIESINPRGYVDNREITNLDGQYLVRGSQNTLIVNREKVASRRGYTLKGSAKTESTGIYSSRDWKMSNGIWRNLRAYGSVLEFWYENEWVMLKNGWVTRQFEFTTWWDKTRLLDQLIFVNGTAKIYSWTGAASKVASVTSSTITKQGYLNASTIGFVENISARDQITDSANGFLTAGFAPGDVITVVGSTTNDGTYIIKEVTAGVITLTDQYTLDTAAAGPSIAISRQDDGTWVSSRYYITAGAGTVVIDGIEYSFTGGSDTGTLTGVSPNPVTNGVSAGDIVTDKIYENAPVALQNYQMDRISMLNNHVFYGSTRSRDVFMSKATDFDDFGFTTPLRKATEGWQMIIDSPPTAFIPDTSQMYVSAGEDEFYRVTFELSADQGGESIIIDKLKTSTGQSAINQGSVVHIKNNVALLTFEPTIDTLGRIQNIDTEQSVPISDDIRDLLERIDTRGAHGFYHRRNLYYCFPEENMVIIYDTRFGYWQPPQTLPISRFAYIDGELCGHSNGSNETYVLFSGPNDNGTSFTARAAFGYENFGSRFNLKNFSELALEAYISRNTVLKDRVLYEYEGAEGFLEFQITADNERRVFAPAEGGGLGVEAFGTVPLGGTQDEVNPLVKVRAINETRAVDFFERQRIFESDTEGCRFEILAFGENTQMSKNEPVFIRE